MKLMGLCKDCEYWETMNQWWGNVKPDHFKDGFNKRQWERNEIIGWCERHCYDGRVEGKPLERVPEEEWPDDVLHMGEKGYMSHNVPKNFGCIHFKPKYNIPA